MRRLAMAALFVAVVAFALAGADASASSGATRAPTARPSPAARVVRPSPSARIVTVRARVTTLDAARASVPIPPPETSPSTTARRPSPAKASRSASRPRLAGDAVWAALARCESNGNPTARSRDGRYTGAFQFSDPTWHSLGYEGRAADHPYEVQLAAAKRLQARSGWGQWPRCARRLGLR